MSISEVGHTPTDKSEDQLDEEAEERFDDESPAEEPHFKVSERSDPDDSPEQPGDEA